MRKGNQLAQPVRLERCPGYNDPRALVEIGIAAMVRMSRSGDPEIAMKAARWLVEYGESLRKSKREANQEDAATVSPDGSRLGRVC